MMQLLVGSNNVHKADEIRAILQSAFGGRIGVVMPKDAAGFPQEIDECGHTLEANAYIKAAEIYERTGWACVADDTGLEVDALGGEPGVFSARYAGENCSYEDNCRKLLQAMDSLPDDRRTAQFRTVICYRDSLRSLFAEGICKGRIIRQARGEHGFGYDPIFVPEGYSLSFAELAPAEKNRISHRALALQNFVNLLRPFVQEN